MSVDGVQSLLFREDGFSDPDPWGSFNNIGLDALPFPSQSMAFSSGSYPLIISGLEIDQQNRFLDSGSTGGSSKYRASSSEVFACQSCREEMTVVSPKSI